MKEKTMALLKRIEQAHDWLNGWQGIPRFVPGRSNFVGDRCQVCGLRIKHDYNATGSKGWFSFEDIRGKAVAMADAGLCRNI